MKPLSRALLIVGAAILPHVLHATDADGDGMEDTWEDSMGLSPTDPLDAFTDLDGDRVPNLWEYNRSTAANSAASVPSFDAIVDSTQPTDALVHRYATLQEAYNSLPDAATDPNYRSLVKVLRGYHNAVLTGAGNPKKVAWVGETGPSRSTGYEAAILSGGLGGVSGMTVTDETVLDALVFESPYFSTPAVRVLPDASLTGLVTEVRMVNCLVRNWLILYDVPNGKPYRGVVVNEGGDLWLVHTTCHASVSQDGAIGTPTYESVVHNSSRNYLLYTPRISCRVHP